MVRLHPEVALYLLEDEPDFVEHVRERAHVGIGIRDDPTIAVDEFRIVSQPAGKGPSKAGQVKGTPKGARGPRHPRGATEVSTFQPLLLYNIKPVVRSALDLGERGLCLPGVIAGLLGYAARNYVGVGVCFSVRRAGSDL